MSISTGAACDDITPAVGAFGSFGGMYVPEILVPALQQLEAAFNAAQVDEQFQQELDGLLRDYAGRRTPLYRCRYSRPAPFRPRGS